MKLGNTIFSTYALLRHRVTAANTLGFGIHSPYLFNIARAILPCHYPYYAFEQVEQVREEILGSKTFACEKTERRSASLKAALGHSRKEQQLLMRLAVMLHAREIVELDAGFGIGSAYLALSDSRAHLTAFEESDVLAKLARKGWQALSIRNVDCVVGETEKALSGWAPSVPLDMAVFSAEHYSTTTLRRFETLLPYANNKSLFVLTDIHYSRTMQRAWKTICQHERVTATMDLGSVGLVFFDPNMEKRTYRIRF